MCLKKFEASVESERVREARDSVWRDVGRVCECWNPISFHFVLGSALTDQVTCLESLHRILCSSASEEWKIFVVLILS